MSRNNISIIIARYNEDLNWIKNIPDYFDIIIYNKGSSVNIPPKKNLKILQLENVGRESHTYLTHIINNYSNLHDINIFCQGDSIAHNENFLELITKYDLFEPIQPLSSYYIKTNKFESVPPIELLHKTKNLNISNIPIYLDYNNSLFKTVYPIYYTNVLLDKVINKIYENYDLFDYIINTLGIKNIDKKYLIPVSYAGIFSVKKDLILNNDVNFYQKLMFFLLNDKQIEGIDNGFIIERLWMSIFNYQKYSSHYKKINSSEYIITNKNLKIKNNYFNFDVILLCENIYITFYINQIINKLYIGKKKIYYKGFGNYFFNKKIISLKKYLQPVQLNIKVYCYSNILSIFINNHNFLNINIEKKKIIKNLDNNIIKEAKIYQNNIIKDPIVYDMLFYNKFHDNLV